MLKVEIVPWDVHEALTGAVEAGRSLDEAAAAAVDGGEDVAGAFGTAAAAQAAFAEFWAARDRLGSFAAETIYHQIDQVSRAAASFISMDQDMSTKAEQTVSTAEAASITDSWARR
ncbi:MULTISPECIES: hypothetical protein [Micrococcus]|uniref:PE domain-containing protein n=1 Tax=Micrococcus lylae TaxID=1273 RepID=A0ABY2JZF9_9MICC|nr:MULTISPECIES: hypothetical protein [Micrococcus]OFR89567.1 hypothetical protein HMPREF2863_08425 [Micrococcus sp. HMSC067E09]TFH99257.1 hypothetical protein E4A49_06315 [Micrococcus lylae]WIK81645.1 hypothetical protein CJ228_008520 [Micrococcus lylae]